MLSDCRAVSRIPVGCEKVLVLQLRAMWPTLLQIGNPSVVRRLRADGTPEFDGRLGGVMKLVCRRTSSRTSLARRSESCWRPDDFV